MLKEGGWYFTTRERIDVGPYPSSSDAATASEKLVALLSHVTAPSQARKVIAGFRSLDGLKD